jgi:phosphate starvation-inducible PhoH-like protein
LILRHSFSPANNTRLGHLCGPLDEHLRTIELALEVKIAHSHEKFKIDGHKAKAERALEMLQAMYERAAKPIPKEQVQLMLAGDEHMAAQGDGSLSLATRRNDVRARTPTQGVYLDNIAQHDITFGIGPAGTGKTYLAVASAVDALERSAVQRIILTRPAVEAGEKLGFLPGDLGQKVDPYLRPLYDALYELMGFDKVQKAFERSALEIAPLAFMRGRTFKNSWIIADEMQNATPAQAKMLMTRIGTNSKIVITGDVEQADRHSGDNGLLDLCERLQSMPTQGIAVCALEARDVQRHRIIGSVLKLYAA